MKLDNRLKAVINEINGICLADIGCDHGKVGAKALLENRVQKVIACDISKPSLEKAIKLFKENNIYNKGDFRCGDGFLVLNENDADVIVIAGMGGLEIINILSSKKVNFNSLILVAHTDVMKLREYLLSQNYTITKDYIVKEGHFYYSLIKCEKNKESLVYDKKHLLLGQSDLNNKDYNMYLDFLTKTYEDLLNNTLPNDIKSKYEEYLDIVNKENGKVKENY